MHITKDDAAERRVERGEGTPELRKGKIAKYAVRDDAREFPWVRRAGLTHSEEHRSNERSEVTNNSADASSVEQEEAKEMGEKNKRENEKGGKRFSPHKFVIIYLLIY